MRLLISHVCQCNTGTFDLSVRKPFGVDGEVFLLFTGYYCVEFFHSPSLERCSG